MKNLDIPYLCTIIGNLSGIPIRLYEGEDRIFYHALVNLPKDPVELYRDDIWKITDHVGYYATDIFNYYGIRKSFLAQPGNWETPTRSFMS